MMPRRLLAAAVLFALAAAPASAQPVPARTTAAETSVVPSNLASVFKPVVAKVTASTVWVRCDDKDAALGTVVFADGYILTKASELRGDVTVRIGDGKKYPAELISTHKPTDLALLKIEAKNLKPVTFADTKEAVLASFLAAPAPDGDPVAVGVVSVLTRKLRGFEETTIINKNRGIIGISFPQFSSEDDEAKVDAVSSKGPAERAGIKRNDVIFEIEGKPIKSILDALETFSEFLPKDKIRVKVKRKDEVVDLGTIELMKRPLDPDKNPGDREELQNTMGGPLSGRRTGFPSVLQTDMVVNPAKCGGPVVDLDGKVLGVNIARAGRVETWVLPGEVIRPLLADMKAGKFPPLSLRKSSAAKGNPEK